MIWFEWLMRILMFVAVAFGFATAAYQTNLMRVRMKSARHLKRDEATLKWLWKTNSLLVATWSFLIILAVVTVVEMVLNATVLRVVCAILEVIAWAFVAFRMLHSD